MLKQRVPRKKRGNYKAFLDNRRGQDGPIKGLPYGCSVSFQGRNWTVAGFDTLEDQTTLRLVDRECRTELLMVPAEDVKKNQTSPWLR